MPKNSKHLKSFQLPQIMGEQFKDKREALGWSIEELAQKTTFSKKQIEQIENGSSSTFYSAQIKFNTAKKIAEILNLTQDEAFERTDTNHTNVYDIPELSRNRPSTELDENVLTNSATVKVLATTKSDDAFKSANFQLKALTLLFIFLVILFTLDSSDSIYELLIHKPLNELSINKPKFIEEHQEINDTKIIELQPIEITSTPKSE